MKIICNGACGASKPFVINVTNTPRKQVPNPLKHPQRKPHAAKLKSKAKLGNDKSGEDIEQRAAGDVGNVGQRENCMLSAIMLDKHLPGQPNGQREMEQIYRERQRECE